MKKVFISYLREDEEKVIKLCTALTEIGVHYWRDREDICPGADWEVAIRDAIRDGSFFIACFSETYNQKANSYMGKELEFAVKELSRNNQGREWFIPMLLSEKAEVPDLRIDFNRTLKNIQWVELYGDKFERGIKQLFQLCNLQIRGLIIPSRGSSAMLDQGYP